MAHLIRQMGHILMATTKLQESAADLSDIVGLRVTHREADTVYMSSNDRQYEVVYRQAEEAGVVAIGLEAMDAAAVEEAQRRVQAAGFRILDDKPLLPGIARAFRFATPFGPVFEIHTPVPRNKAARYIGPGNRPRRLEHVNVRVADMSGFRDFLTSALGMKISDRTRNDELIWFRGWDGFHHTIAAGRGSNLHHYAFDAHSLEDLSGIADNLSVKGRTLLWGLGRHGAGDNIFSYYRDPNGCAVETSVGLARIENDELYEPRTWDLQTSLVRNLWGVPSPAEFNAAGIPYLVEQ